MGASLRSFAQCGDAAVLRLGRLVRPLLPVEYMTGVAGELKKELEARGDCVILNGGPLCFVMGT